jgi:hypothetical protein
MLGLTEFAAEMLDHCIESLDGFKETVLDKWLTPTQPARASGLFFAQSFVYRRV